MEKLTALELIVLMFDVGFALNHNSSGRYRHLHAYLFKKLRDELHSRDEEEIVAGLIDLKSVDPGLSEECDKVLVEVRTYGRVKRQQS